LVVNRLVDDTVGVRDIQDCNCLGGKEWRYMVVVDHVALEYKDYELLDRSGDEWEEMGVDCKVGDEHCYLGNWMKLFGDLDVDGLVRLDMEQCDQESDGRLQYWEQKRHLEVEEGVIPMNSLRMVRKDLMLAAFRKDRYVNWLHVIVDASHELYSVLLVHWEYAE
jgi:hypothetical protein